MITAFAHLTKADGQIAFIAHDKHKNRVTLLKVSADQIIGVKPINCSSRGAQTSDFKSTQYFMEVRYYVTIQ